jgi:hypothetical protein
MLDINRRNFLAGGLTLQALGANSLPGWAARRWKLDPRCVLTLGEKGSFDARVVGDPCIVWDEGIRSWRMFYFASPGLGAGEPQRGRIAGMAVSRSADEIGPGDWRKAGPARVANPFPEIVQRNGHKFWVVMDPKASNCAARIDGRYWGLFIVGIYKHVYAAWTRSLSEAWTVIEKPILSPGQADGAFDGRHCDTPTAVWMADRGEILIFYKAYPREAQSRQPKSPFGSSSVAAWWRPFEPQARKANQILVPGRSQSGGFVRGWVGGVQLLWEAGQSIWYALLNGSPTAPEDDSHREPAPSLGGWAVCSGGNPDSGWTILDSASPFVTPERLTDAERKAGLGVNFWRHHLLVTPTGESRIFFNSGPYGTEQMYSLTPVNAQAK